MTTRNTRILALSQVVALATLSTNGVAGTLYVAPTGIATTVCARSEPCSLGVAASSAQPGDVVILMDGTYVEPLDVVNSGTAAEWITFQADECATPIIEGPGPGPNDDNQDTGVGSKTAQYLRFVGIVARGWNMGFANGWTDGVPGSNGHWEIENCLSYSNTRTGFTFFSGEQFHLKNSISAHNGSSVLHSWSSGVTLYQTSGVNVVEGTVSFENTDAQKHTDGSGFIVDEGAHGALFLNNIAFGNGGSCLRLTKSHSTRFVNNTCYHNAQDPQADGPPNPSELYFTEDGNGTTKENVKFINNVFVATGVGGGAEPVYNQPTTGWSNNISTTGAVGFFADPEGANPNFTLSNAATDLAGKGLADQDVSQLDIGFDPKCVVKRAPTLVGGVASAGWWQYDIDIDYIKSLGGVKGCFNPAARASSDIGAYAAGAVATRTPGGCVPTVDPVSPDPVSSEPVSPDPVSPVPVSPDPVGPSTVDPVSGDPSAVTPTVAPVDSAMINPGGVSPTPSASSVSSSTPSVQPQSGVNPTTVIPTTGPSGGAVAPPGTTATDGAVSQAPNGGESSSGDPSSPPIASTTDAGCGCSTLGAHSRSAAGSVLPWAFGLLTMMIIGRKRSRSQR